MNLLYQIKKGNITLIPNVGLYYEQANKDKDNKLVVSGTGGNVLFESTGISAFYKKISISMTFQLPIKQYLYDVQPLNINSLILGISYILEKTK